MTALKNTNLDVIILAAGLGTRMKSAKIKILHRAAGRPIIDYVLDLAAQVSERPPRELVVATTVGRGVNATMNFLIEPAAGGASEVSTETRVVADTPAATRRFGAYWHTIYPGS